MMNTDASAHNQSAVRAETPIPGTICVRGYRNTLYGRKAVFGPSEAVRKR